MFKMFVIGFLLLSGCATTYEGDPRIAKGGCDRVTGYGIKFDVLGFHGNFMLNAKCETTEPEK